MNRIVFILLALTVFSNGMLAQKQSTKMFAAKKETSKKVLSAKKTTVKKNSVVVVKNKPLAKKIIAKKAPSKNETTAKLKPKSVIKKATLKNTKNKIVAKNAKNITISKKNTIVTKKQPIKTTKAVVAKKKKTVNTIKEKIFAKNVKTVSDKKQTSIVKANTKTKELINKENLNQTKAITLVKIKEPKKIIQKVPALVLHYPLEGMDSIAFIKHHFGKIKINESGDSKSDYYNESLTFVTPLNSNVMCVVDTAVVIDVTLDDDSVYTVFVKKEDYVVVYHNLAVANVNIGDTIVLNQIIGTVASDEMHEENGVLELMVFYKEKILNPEKFIKPKQIVVKENIIE